MTTAGPLDEMVDGRGGLRPHWRNLLGVMSELGRETLVERAIRLDRAFEEEGVSSLLPGAEPEGRQCDPIPLLLSEREFATLADGLAQRARLFEAILADLYGPQSLIADGLIPPALVYANPAFLRPCRVGQGDGGRRLLFYAADVTRGGDGSWCVLADHTGWADGVARALENRRMLARVVPEIFHPHQVRQLRPFLDAWQDTLQALAHAGGKSGVALISPGHTDPSWFDHVLLARELSCALVEGGDLTVRGDGLFLKTLRGLQPIGVLLRALDGQSLDPLELAPDGLGVPGLLDAARGGCVRVANDPGSALAEAPGLIPFLSALAARLLGEKLALPSIPTRWLGAAGGHDLGSLAEESWAIRSAIDPKVMPVALGPLSPQVRERVRARVAEASWAHAACQPVASSVAPCLGETALFPRPVVLRLFLIWDGSDWVAMPGGLARALPREGDTGWALPERGLAKDVWVLSEDQGTLVLPPAAPVPSLAIRRTTGDLPSRAADNFFWLGRYLERLESAARLQRTAIARIVRPAPSARELAELQMLTDCLANAGLVAPEIDISLGADQLADAMLGAGRERGSTGRLLAQVTRMTALLRDRLTGEMYAAMSRSLRELSEALRGVRRVPDGEELDELAHATSLILRFSATVAGLAAENMVRGGGRLFLDLGRRVERAQSVAEEMASLVQDGTTEPGHVELALRLALELRDSVITYRSRYLGVLQLAPALDLVLADEGNPRGLAFQLAMARDLLAEIAGTPDSTLAAAAGALLAEAQEMVRGVAKAPDQIAVATLLPLRLIALRDSVSELSDRVSRRYFALLPAAHSVGVEVQPALRGAA